MKVCLRTPGEVVPDNYFQCRFRTLREPLGFNLGDERLEDDGKAIHAWIEERGRVIGVGRAHLIPHDSNGKQADHGGEGAATCPPFSPLDGEMMFPDPHELRPAFQIRQMGVEVEHRRRGLGGLILESLEHEAIRTWGVRSGWLQARKEAITFYTHAGWQTFGDAYNIIRIGEHRSMWKPFSEPTI